MANRPKYRLRRLIAVVGIPAAMKPTPDQATKCPMVSVRNGTLERESDGPPLVGRKRILDPWKDDCDEVLDIHKLGYAYDEPWEQWMIDWLKEREPDTLVHPIEA